MAGLIRRSDIDEVRSRTNLADIVGDYVSLKNAGEINAPKTSRAASLSSSAMSSPNSSNACRCRGPQVAMVMPGYLRRFTLAYYLQALVPHAMPSDSVVSLLQSVFQDVPSATMSLFWLLVAVVVFLGLAMRAIERREYVLEQ